MKIENLKIGMRIKSYRQLCELLGEKIKNGDSKKSQIKKFETYFKFHKDGNAFIIDEIYEIPKNKVDLRAKGNNRIYGEHLEVIMLYLLSQSEDGILECSATRAMEMCSMVNSNYLVGRGDVELLSKVSEVEKQYIYDFYGRTHSKLKDAFERTLKSMRNKALADYSEVYKIIDEDDDGRLTCKREATMKERKLILEIEREVILGLKCDSKQEVFAKGLWSDFTSLVKLNIKNRLGISEYFNVYKIVINEAGVKQEIDKIESDIAKGRLGENLVNGLNTSAFRRHHKNKPSFGVNPNNIATNENFVTSHKKLISILIDRECSVDLKR